MSLVAVGIDVDSRVAALGMATMGWRGWGANSRNAFTEAPLPARTRAWSALVWANKSLAVVEPTRAAAGEKRPTALPVSSRLQRHREETGSADQVALADSDVPAGDGANVGNGTAEITPGTCQQI